MDTKKILSLDVNGIKYTKAVFPSTTLLDFLRDELNLTGTKKGCDIGECGCCSVLVDGKPALSCLILAFDAIDKKIITIEGIKHPVQDSFVDHGAIQCGFCIPSMVVNAVSLLENKKNPTKNDAKECISGTICRCTGYTKIEKAILNYGKK